MVVDCCQCEVDLALLDSTQSTPCGLKSHLSKQNGLRLSHFLSRKLQRIFKYFARKVDVRAKRSLAYRLKCTSTTVKIVLTA